MILVEIGFSSLFLFIFFAMKTNFILSIDNFHKNKAKCTSKDPKFQYFSGEKLYQSNIFNWQFSVRQVLSNSIFWKSFSFHQNFIITIKWTRSHTKLDHYTLEKLVSSQIYLEFYIKRSTLLMIMLFINNADYQFLIWKRLSSHLLKN